MRCSKKMIFLWVCACYMYAIIKANTLSCYLADSDTEQSYLALNENLAITVGMSVLRAFVLSSINSNEELSEITKDTLGKRIDKGIIFPDCNHGNYRSNFASELHYTKIENNYNVLSLANTLFLLETHTLQTEAVHKQGKNKNTANKKVEKINAKTTLTVEKGCLFYSLSGLLYSKN